MDRALIYEKTISSQFQNISKKNYTIIFDSIVR